MTAITKQDILKQYFGYDSFRDGQAFLVDSILDGKDVVGVMPTGAGKSICFQVPAMMFEGITLVISPLISLMKDQVNTLNQVGIKAAYLNSSLTSSQYNKVLQNARDGEYKLIYVAPERLLSEEFLEFAQSSTISLFYHRRSPLYFPVGTGFSSKLFKDYRLSESITISSSGVSFYSNGYRSGSRRYCIQLETY